MKLYDLALADIDVRPSPWCWLAKFALLHKGVDFETVPLRFADKAQYPDPNMDACRFLSQPTKR